MTFASSPAAKGKVYIGDFEARVTPIADTDSATALSNKATLAPGTYQRAVRRTRCRVHPFDAHGLGGPERDQDVRRGSQPGLGASWAPRWSPPPRAASTPRR